MLDAGAAGFLHAARESGIDLLDITLEHAAIAGVLPPLHRDPFDRMIAAQGIADQMTVMTSEAVFKRYKGVRVIDA